MQARPPQWFPAVGVHSDEPQQFIGAYRALYLCHMQHRRRVSHSRAHAHSSALRARPAALFWLESPNASIAPGPISAGIINVHTHPPMICYWGPRGERCLRDFSLDSVLRRPPSACLSSAPLLTCGPSTLFPANSLWDSCRLLRSLRQVLVEAPQRFRKPPCEAGRFCGSFSLFRDSLVPPRCETLEVNRRSVSGSSLLGSKWNIPAGLRTMTSPALQPSGLWLPCRVGVKAHRTFRSGNYYASGVNLSLRLGKFLLP
jgi:hypothetical protein